MHSDLVELGWSEEHLHRIEAVVSEEAQRARVGAQILGLAGPVDAATTAIPRYSLTPRANALPSPPFARQRLEVCSDPDLYFTRIAVNVHLRMQEAAEPSLQAALTMFRRAANYIARIEDALIFNGRPGPNAAPGFGVGAIPDVYTISGEGVAEGIIPLVTPAGDRSYIRIPVAAGTPVGEMIVTAVNESITQLDEAGQLGPYACALAPDLFEAICTPNGNLVMPRDRILPLLQGPLVRASTICRGHGVVVALSANPVELVVGSDIGVRFLQTNEQPRLVFQVYERVAVRIKESAAIAIMN